MATKKYTVKYRRKTNTSYKNRIKLISSGKTRLVIRKTNTNMIVQFVNFEPKGDRIITGANSKELKKLGYNTNKGNIPSAYLTGLLAGKKAKNKKIKEAILDIGLQKRGQRLFSALKGVLDSGINIPHSDEIIPNEKRLKGEHIKNHSGENFESVKNKILKE